MLIDAETGIPQNVLKGDSVCLNSLGAVVKWMSRRGIALLAGLAPVNCDSGEMRGQRHIKGGRGHVRKALYMAAIAAARCNPSLKIFRDRLRTAGKAPKVAITAVMRKLVMGGRVRSRGYFTNSKLPSFTVISTRARSSTP